MIAQTAKWRKDDCALETCHFTAREEDVLACVPHCKSSRKIAALLEIEPKSVDTHMYNITNKLGLHSRNDLITLIEQSRNFEALCIHYATLIRAHHFREALQKTATYTRGQHITCRILCTNTKLLRKITLNLKKVGVGVVGRGQGEQAEIKTIQIVLPTESGVRPPSVPLAPFSVPSLLVHATGNDEVLFFEIIHLLYPGVWIEEARDYFAKTVIYEHRQNNHASVVHSLKRRVGWRLVTIVMLVICICLFSCIKVYTTSSKPSDAICVHSVCAIPDDSHRLDRKELSSKITACFNNVQSHQGLNNGIQTVVLVGIGGSGKTTIARQYAKTQNAPVVWEINAETQQTVLDSFTHLAWALSKTPEERIDLERMRRLDNQLTYRKKLIQFIKQKLVSYPADDLPWILIFDDVNILGDIQDFLPLDTKAWGKGKILITTRNSNMANNTLTKPSNIITVDELSQQEKVDLFLKIKEVPETQHQKLREFLQIIPSFPLDVSIAAYYLKNTNSSYDEYLKQLQIEHAKISARKNINTIGTINGDYTQNRQSIIACTVERMLPQHKDFAPLLLLVSTIGNRTIPKELLKRHSRPEVVDCFVQQMCQSSLLHYDKQFALKPTLSIHGSTQEAVLRYLMQIFTVEEKQKYVDTIADLIFDYVEDVAESLDYSVLPSLVPHVLSFSQYVQGFRKVKMDFQLGHIHYHLGDHVQAKRFFDTVLTALKPCAQGNTKEQRERRTLLLQTLVHASSVDVHVGRFKEAKALLEESLTIHRDKFGQDQPCLATALMYYGRLSREMGNYDVAMVALKKSNAIFNKYYSDDHPKTAWAQFRLGEVYSSLGQTDPAKQYYEKSLKTYQDKYGHNHRRTLWILFRLGTVYRTEGDYRKARALLEEVYHVYKDKYKEDRDGYTFMAPHLGDMYRRLGLYQQARPLLESSQNFYKQQYPDQRNIYAEWCSFFLGRFYADSGVYEKARQLLERSLAVHTEQLGADHIKTMRIKRTLASTYAGLGQFNRAQGLYECCLRSFAAYFGNTHVEYACVLYRFGHLCMMRKEYAKAKIMLNRALAILDAKKHTETYRCYEYLGDLHMAQGDKGDIKKAMAAYHQAFRIACVHFPQKSVHIARLKTKVSILQRFVMFVQSVFQKQKESKRY